MADMIYPHWQATLQVAILAGATEYRQRLADAKVIVRGRLNAIEGNGSFIEQHALYDALRIIRELENSPEAPPPEILLRHLQRSTGNQVFSVRGKAGMKLAGPSPLPDFKSLRIEAEAVIARLKQERDPDTRKILLHSLRLLLDQLNTVANEPPRLTEQI